MPAYSVHESILDGVATVLAALSLDGLQDRVYRRLTMSETFLLNVLKPCLVYAPVGTEEELSSTTGKDDWGYPVTVAMVDDNDADQSTDKIPNYLKWRKIIKRAFVHKKLSGITEQWECLLQPSPMLTATGAEYNLTIMPLVFQFRAREVRT